MDLHSRLQAMFDFVRALLEVQATEVNWHDNKGARSIGTCARTHWVWQTMGLRSCARAIFDLTQLVNVDCKQRKAEAKQSKPLVLVCSFKQKRQNRGHAVPGRCATGIVYKQC